MLDDILESFPPSIGGKGQALSAAVGFIKALSVDAPLKVPRSTIEPTPTQSSIKSMHASTLLEVPAG